ncbi:MAG: extracellular solute-binding protein [Chloroflexi bacterium]|nr:extracellular solute-binding protein [Chloroflexota bacterium]
MVRNLSIGHGLRALLILQFVLVLTLISCARPQEPLYSPVAQEPVAPVAAKPLREGWEEKWDKVVQEAKREGQVVMYVSVGAANIRDFVVKNMKEKYGIDVDIVVAKGNELSEKIFSERRAGIYIPDIYVGGATSVVSVLIPAGVFDPIENALILPEVKEPKFWLGGKLPYFESGKYGIRVMVQVMPPLAINTSLITAEKMGSFADLLSPELKGKIIMSDPTVSGNGQDFFYNVGMKMMGLDFMRGLAKQEPAIQRDSRLQAEWLARGKYAVLVGPNADPVTEFRKAGAPVTLLPYMKEGGWLSGGSGHIQLMRNAPHPKAAATFVNWILSREGQTHWSKNQMAPSTRIDVPTEGFEPFMVPDPSKRYLQEDEEGIMTKAKTAPTAREIFNIR